MSHEQIYILIFILTFILCIVLSFYSEKIQDRFMLIDKWQTWINANSDLEGLEVTEQEIKRCLTLHLQKRLQQDINKKRTALQTGEAKVISLTTNYLQAG